MKKLTSRRYAVQKTQTKKRRYFHCRFWSTGTRNSYKCSKITDRDQNKFDLSKYKFIKNL